MIFKKYDVFISYAVEDKLTVAAPLTEKLKALGLKVFFAGRELDIGDEIGDLIHTGLRKSKFGLVILSPSYNRSWTLGELFNLLDKENQEKQAKIMPVWHQISYTEVLEKFPRLGSRYALTTNTDLDLIAAQIADKVTRWKRRKMFSQFRQAARFAIPFVAVLLFRQFEPEQKIRELIRPPDAEIKPLINRYIDSIGQQFAFAPGTAPQRRCSRDLLLQAFRDFAPDGKNIENNFVFTDGRFESREDKQFRDRHVNVFLKQATLFDLDHPDLFELTGARSPRKDTLYMKRFMLINWRPIACSIRYADHTNKQLQVKITNNIRTVEITLLRLKKKNPVRFIKVSGIYPQLELGIVKENKAWKLREDG